MWTREGMGGTRDWGGFPPSPPGQTLKVTVFQSSSGKKYTLTANYAAIRCLYTPVPSQSVMGSAGHEGGKQLTGQVCFSN